MPVTATGTGRREEPFFNIGNSDTNVITKGKGIPDTHIQDHANTSCTALSMANGNGVLFTGSIEIPSIADSATRTSAPVAELQRPNFLALDLQLPSRQSGKNNYYGSLVKEEKLDQSLSEHHNNVPIANEINASGNSILGRLPNLDLNILPDPADSLEGLPKMDESGSGLYHHRTIQHQKAQVTPAAAIYTISSGIGRNIGSTLNMSNSYGLSHKSGPADVTLDLQLKPPARPELGINWKGLAPAPELSLSLFGKPMDEPKSLSTPNALFDSGTAGSSKKVNEEAPATLVSDDAPVEKIVTPMPWNVNPQNTTSATVSGIDQLPSNNLVKKEHEEISQQHILDGAERANLSERQSVGLVISCAESEKTDSAPQGPRKTGFDLNSDISTNNIIHNGPDVAAVSVPVPAESLPDTSHAKTMPAVPEVDKCVNPEESTSATPSLPVVETGSGHTTLLMEAKSLPSQSNVASPSVGLCESSSQPTAHEDTRQRSCDANESSGASPSSSSPPVEPLPFNSLENAIVDGMSQGSAEMDCSDDDGNTVSRIPTTNKPHGEPLGNGPPISKDGINTDNLSKELKKEHDSDMHQDCSSMTNKVNIDPIEGGKCIKTKVGVVSHAGQQGLRNEVIVSENSKGKQSLNSDKNIPVNYTDNSIHDAKTATGSSTTHLQKSSAFPKSDSPKLQPTKHSPKTLDSCLEKTRSPDIKSPNGMQAGSCSENHAKIAALKTEHQTKSEEVGKHSDLRPRDSVLGEDSELDGASSSQQHSEYGKKSASEKSEHDKSKPDSCNTSLQNEKDGQLVGANWTLGHVYVNRNERWERFMESEREKNNGECHGGRHASDVMNKRMTNHRGGWRGAGSRGHLRNFRGPRMSNEFVDESIGGRRRSFEDEPGHIRGPHRRRHSPPHGCIMREMDIDDFYGREIPDSRLLARGQIEDLPDDMMDDRFFMPHSHRHRGQAGLHTEEELVGRRKHRERRAYLHSPVSDEDEMLSYQTEDDMEFAEGGVGPREHDGRFRNRMGHSRARGEQEDGYRHRGGHQGWRDSDSNDRPKRRRY
ncbi:unnamed protein product [Miscanthus lutarioriparius]|uniref:Uncharacterized protein n=1 Tax=Miscanthus lutarioriparius TaxID=422564 RepID=A0A811MPG4_9POAL|nr:unnamed protein product [Miscanthus lutarioriparius]